MDAESGQSYSMVAHSINLLQEEGAKPEKEDCVEPEEAWPSMVGHQVVVGVEEESVLPYYASMAAHCSFDPEWKEEGIVSSGVSHQLINHCERVDEEEILKQNVPAKWEEMPSSENHLERGVREAEVRDIREEAEIDPRRSHI